MNYEILKDEFKNEINGNFLIKILTNVLTAIKKDIYLYYNFSTEDYFSKNLSLSEFAFNEIHLPEIDICKHIIGLHNSNTFGLSSEEKKQKMKDYNYQQKLIKEVITSIKLRIFGSSLFRNNTLSNEDRYLYHHVPYYLFVICMRMQQIFNSNYELLKNFNYNILGKIQDMGLSSLLLIECNCFDNTYSICRGMLELFTNLYAFNENPQALKMYTTLLEEQNYFEKFNNYSNEFLSIYNNRTILDNKVQYDNFMHFGWVDNIKNYHNIVRSNPYTRKSLIKYLNYQYPNGNWNIVDELYAKCNSFTHASLLTKHVPSKYLDLICILYNILTNIYKYLCENLNLDSTINGVDILQLVDEKFEMLQRRSKNIKNLVIN